ncbi:MAG TPA: GNAT family N-acetyltransferase [Vitreimonas sp.]|nr:GNAT family N-acetyltransferase [Vitreimonas sp.]
MAQSLVRNATSADALAIAQIHVKTWQCTYRGQVPDSFLDSMSVQQRKEDWQKALDNPAKDIYALVAEVDSKIVGWCTGGVNRDEDVDKDTGELHGIYIDPEYIAKGVGTALMEYLLQLLRKDGYKKATLWVLDTNQQTREFYEKKGWRVEGRTKVEPRDGFSLNEVRYIIEL